MPSLALLASTFDSSKHQNILNTVILSALAYYMTVYLVPIFGDYTRKKGIFGKDLCKKGTSAGNLEMFVF